MPQPEFQPRIDELFRKRIVLISGKGGVGRTTVTASLALAAARAGKRVLLTEIVDSDSDYSALARIFGRDRLPNSPSFIAPGIQGAHLEAKRGHEFFLSSVLHTATLAKAALSSDALQRLLYAAPSFREMGLFYHLLTFLRATLPNGEPAHELVLLDMPATGHALALTGLPQIILRLISKGPIVRAMQEGQSFLNDPEKGAAYVVTLPERLPISEALELIEGLESTKIPVGGLILNRMPEDPFTPAGRALVHEWIAREKLLGSEEFLRQEESKKSMERLRASTRYPVLTLPQRPRSDAKLVEYLAGVLAPGAVAGEERA